MANHNGHGRRGGSFEPNSYRAGGRDWPFATPNSARPDDDRVTDRGGQPGGSHYYADRDDRRGGHYGEGPQGFERSDERIWELVCEALYDDDQVDATHVTVEVTRGEVTLDGIVRDRRMKRLAEDCVERVAGVKDVQNRLKVHQLHG